MENLSKLWAWLKILPLWLRALVMVLIVTLVFIASLGVSACGTPKTVATVQNVNPNSTVTVTMSVSNSTTTTPSVDTDNSLTSMP